MPSIDIGDAGVRAHRHGGQLGENCTVFLTDVAEFGARTLSPTASAIQGVTPAGTPASTNPSH